MTIIALYYKRLDVESIGSGPADELGLEGKYNLHHNINFLIQELKPYVNTGDCLLRPALKSPVVNNRNMALSVLEAWVKEKGTSLEVINKGMFDYLKTLIDDEVVDDVRERMKKLIENLPDNDSEDERDSL